MDPGLGTCCLFFNFSPPLSFFPLLLADLRAET